MVDGACIRSINHFQDPQTKGFILESNSWNEFSNKINLLGNDRKNNKKIFHYFHNQYFCSRKFELLILG